jgi:hypothetical protein
MTAEAQHGRDAKITGGTAAGAIIGRHRERRQRGQEGSHHRAGAVTERS